MKKCFVLLLLVSTLITMQSYCMDPSQLTTDEIKKELEESERFAKLYPEINAQYNEVLAHYEATHTLDTEKTVALFQALRALPKLKKKPAQENEVKPLQTDK